MNLTQSISAGNFANVNQNTNTLTGMNGTYNHPQGVNIFDSWNSNMMPGVKKYEVYESPVDILVLSATWKRLRDNGNAHGIISKLLDAALFAAVSSEDHALAVAIRLHYSQKMMLWTLTDKYMTKYRKDLNTFIQSDGTHFREDMLGLSYHLPAFYEYDKQLDEVRLQVVSTKVPAKALRDNRTLKPLKRIVFKNKRTNTVQYWLQDSETDTATLITIENKNPLEHLWNHIFNSSATIEVTGNFNLKKRDNFEYASVNNWSLSKS
jgi:hypothetical protein